MDTSKKLVLVTHNGVFHADDIFACAIISLVLKKEGKDWSVIRTRDPEVITQGDYVFDVGGEYDPSKKRFDHHQKGGAGMRSNGTPYAACGLLWKEYGDSLTGNPLFTQKIDEKIFQPIDSDDNGIKTFTEIGDVSPYLAQSMLYAFRTTWKEDEKEMDAIFVDLVSFAEKIITREIKHKSDAYDARTLAQEAYEKSPDKRLIVMDTSFPAEEILMEYPEPLYMIRPNSDGTWRATGVSLETHSFDRRKPFPAEWAGLRDEELQKVTGVSGATFCHNGRWLVVAKTKQDILALAQMALER